MEKIKRTRLTESQKSGIINYRRLGMKHTDIAARLGISQGTVSRILSNVDVKSSNVTTSTVTSSVQTQPVTTVTKKATKVSLLDKVKSFFKIN